MGSVYGRAFSKERKRKMKKKCDVCGKKAEGLGTVPTQFKDVVLCSSCYEGLKAFEHGRGGKTKEVLEKKQQLAINEMKERDYPQVVIENVYAWFEEKIKGLEKESAYIDEAFMMTTCHNFEGYRISAYHGIVSGESVLGTGFLSSWNASFSDMLGAESDSYIGKLHEAREYAKQRIIKECVKRQGNALIGIDIEYTMFRNDMIAVIIHGTSVTIEKIEQE